MTRGCARAARGYTVEHGREAVQMAVRLFRMAVRLLREAVRLLRESMGLLMDE